MVDDVDAAIATLNEELERPDSPESSKRISAS